MVKSNQIFSVQEYCDKVLGFCPIVNGEQDELRKILDKEGHSDLWDYPLEEIDHIVENNLNVVLVDCSYVDEKCQTVHEYRWFEVPDNYISDL